MKLALGTVQFGLPYGIANQGGRVDDSAAAAILDYARQSGIDTIDTAIGYGISEAVLGRIGLDGLRVITKLPPVPADAPDVTEWVVERIGASLERLRIERLGGVLLHQSSQLLGPQGAQLAAALQSLKDRGLVEKIGISIYAPDDLSRLLEVCQIDLLQAPLNLIDRRLATSGWLERLGLAGVEVHVRSVFLQGLLLMPSVDRPARFARWDKLWRKWDHWLAQQPEDDGAAACIGFANSFRHIDRLVVGVDSLKQLEALVAAVDRTLSDDFPNIACSDEELINPALWDKL